MTRFLLMNNALDDEILNIIKQLSKIYEAGQIMYNTRMRYKIMKSKAIIRFISDKDERRLYMRNIKFIEEVWKDKNVSKVKKARFAKSVIRKYNAKTKSLYKKQMKPKTRKRFIK